MSSVVRAYRTRVADVSPIDRAALGTTLVAATTVSLAGDAPVVAAAAAVLSIAAGAMAHIVEGTPSTGRPLRMPIGLAGVTAICALGAALHPHVPILYGLSFPALAWLGANVRGRSTLRVVALLSGVMGLATHVAIGPSHAALALILGAAAPQLGDELARRRAASRDDSDDRLLADRARRGAPPQRAEEDTLARDAGRSLQDAVLQTLSILRAAMRGHSAVVVWTDFRNRTARVRWADTADDTLREGPWSDRAGLLGLAARAETPTVLNAVPAASDLLPWYGELPNGRHVVAVPLVDEGNPLGFLVVDRPDSLAPFAEPDTFAAVGAAAQIMRAIQTERLLIEATRSRAEVLFLHEATEALNAALTVDEVADVVRRLANRSVPVEWLLMTRTEEDGETHRVVHASGPDAAQYLDRTAAREESLVEIACRRGHPVPYDGRRAEGCPPLLTARIDDGDHRAMLVVPVAVGQRCIGTLAFSSAETDAFDRAAREHLRLIATQAAAPFANALSYARLLHMATCDGMTGLTNHRTFKERAAEAWERASRNGRPLCILMFDVDHFKRVNDTWGHAAGDQVIIAVAGVLRAMLRKVDVGARYGGEEFAVILEDTEMDAAAVLGERLRTAIGNLVFDGGGQPFQITSSAGVARLVPSMTTVGALIEAADQALYAAKRTGRNRLVRADAMPDADGT